MTHRGQYEDFEDGGGWQQSQGRHQRTPYPQQRYQGQQDPWRSAHPQGGYQDQPDPQQGMHPSVRYSPSPAEPERYGGAEGNERLTVITGAVLLLLLAAEGITILHVDRLLTLHFFIGMLLLGPVVLKAGSVLYRFYRYYSGSAPYRRKGPPAPLLRMLGPFVLLLTACVFGSGVMLAIVGPAGRHPWLTIHKAAFILWFGAMAIHVLAYVPRLPRLLYAEARGAALPDEGGARHAAGGWPATRTAQFIGGRGVRLSLLIASLALGLVIALLTVHTTGAWQNPGKVFFHP